MSTITVPSTGGGGGGATDHGDLTGLADDDHAQYTTTAEATTIASTAAAAVVDAAPATLDTLNELAAALGDDADFAGTVTTALGTKASTTDLSNHEADTTNIHGITDTSALATDAEVTTAVSDHAAAVNPHPTYLTQAEGDAAYEVAGAVATHAAAGNPHPTYATDTDLSNHEADTTNIHGIVDTSALETTSGATTKVSNHAAAADPHTGYVLESLFDAAGDLITASADNTPARLAKGTALQVLRVNAGATGLEYATPSAGGGADTTLYDVGLIR